MTNIGQVLQRLGIEQYLDAFITEGFDTWETVLDIQESDLDALNVKLGHRRKLQREIANYRGLSYERSLGSPGNEPQGDSGRGGDSEGTVTGQQDRGIQGETKRKYRRHPKPDENAPERPPSAYVIFSNKIREDVRGQNLSFTEIAKLVGEHWQTLVPAEKEPYEAQAASAKEKYAAEMAEYKKTDQYKDYVQYLAEFKAKHGGGSAAEGKQEKRPKLEQESSNATSGSSGGSGSAKPGESYESSIIPPSLGHGRGESRGSAGSASQLSSPGGFFSNAPHPRGATPGGLIPSASTGSTDSPPLPMLQRGSAMTSPFPPMDPTDANARSNLQLPPPMPGSFPLSANTGQRRSGRLPAPLLHHQDTSNSGSLGSTSNVSSGSGSSGQIPMYPTTPSEDPWQQRPPGDVPRPIHPALATYPATTNFTSLPPIKCSDRSSDSSTPQRKYRFPNVTSATSIADFALATQAPTDPTDSGRRSLPPLSGVRPPETRRRLRSQSRGTTETSSPRDMSDTITSTTDALAVLAYAGGMLEAEKQRHARQEEQRQ